MAGQMLYCNFLGNEPAGSNNNIALNNHK